MAVFTCVIPLAVWAESLRLRRESDFGERKFRSIFDQTFAFIGLLDTDGILLEANKAALDALETTSYDVIGKPFWETPWWSHSQAVRNELRAAIAVAARGETVQYETEFVAPDRIISVDFSLQRIQYERESANACPRKDVT